MQGLKSKHKAETDSILLELNVFKAVIEGLAAKCRYLQVFKTELESQNLQLIKQRHVNERLRRENKEIKEENRGLRRKVDRMMRLIVDYTQEEAEGEEWATVEMLLKENMGLREILHYGEAGVEEAVEAKLREEEDGVRGVAQDEEMGMPEVVKRVIEAKRVIKERQKETE